MSDNQSKYDDIPFEELPLEERKKRFFRPRTAQESRDIDEAIDSTSWVLAYSLGPVELEGIIDSLDGNLELCELEGIIDSLVGNLEDDTE